jgi:hypothetical protein
LFGDTQKSYIPRPDFEDFFSKSLRITPTAINVFLIFYLLSQIKKPATIKGNRLIIQVSVHFPNPNQEWALLHLVRQIDF